MTSQTHRALSIDEAYLLRKYPDLAILLRQGYHPDEVGEAWLHRAQRAISRQHSQLRQLGASEDWAQAKEILHRVLYTEDPEFAIIRGRLFARAGIRTPEVVSSLSLWLAGHLGLSLTTVTPLVAVMLYEIATGNDRRPVETTG
jgi:hypothetical protein